MSLAFLSEEHLAAAAEALGNDAAFLAASKGVTVRLNYVITGGPHGDFSYYIAVVNGVGRLGRGELDEPDARLRSSYDTAADVSRGDMSSQMAVMTRKIRVRGSVATIMKNMATLARIEATINGMDIEY